MVITNRCNYRGVFETVEWKTHRPKFNDIVNNGFGDQLLLLAIVFMWAPYVCVPFVFAIYARGTFALPNKECIPPLAIH